MKNSHGAAKPDLLDDCRMMLDFAVKEGLEPDQVLRGDIAALDALLLKAGLETISEVPAGLLHMSDDVQTPQIPTDILPSNHAIQKPSSEP